jgi:hypothetical protein
MMGTRKGSRVKRGSRRPSGRPVSAADRSLLDDLLQRMHPEPLRIELPGLSTPEIPPRVSPSMPLAAPAPPPEERVPGSLPADSAAMDRTMAEVAICLWYLKTKHFRRQWADEDITDDDARTRRALGRLNKGIAAMTAGGVEVVDPTNKRYPPGSDALMRPLQFQPTAGLTYEKVTETVMPIVFCRDRLIQRGEVFVAVPEASPAGPGRLESAGPGRSTTSDAPRSADS